MFRLFGAKGSGVFRGTSDCGCVRLSRGVEGRAGLEVGEI